jgi:hypothetical protein
MSAIRTFGTKRIWAIALVAVMVLSALGAAVAASSSAPSSSARATTASPAVTHVSTPAASTGGTTAQAAVSPSDAGPHPGTIEAYEPVPGGATTEDPAVAYDTTSYEPILNVYQTLVSYNGSSTATFVPTLATCVPGQNATPTTGCASDYGAGFTGIFNATGANFTGSNGAPVYWTYVLDPAAHFYDPSTRASWKVYPSDVMFSIARTIAWSDDSLKTAGWIVAQSLLPPGNSTWDKGTHFPYNSTPEKILGSMLVNDSKYCPATAMNGIDGNGCITFVADGSGQVWPEFNEFVEDNLGASVVPCGWFTFESAGLPGWSGTTAANGDGSCTLPDGGTTTNATAWTTYIAGLSPTSWDTLESSVLPNYPTEEPKVQWTMVGSGPYYASINVGLSYALAPNPAYVQPSGCSGTIAAIAVYSGYCDPAKGKYIANVDVTWETSEQGDSLGTDSILAGTADFAGIYTTETSTLLGFVHSGLWQYILFPTLSTAFTPINLGISYNAYNTTFAGTPLESNPIPPTLLTDLALRNFYVDAYPYTTVQDTINTVDGVDYAFNAGGPIPFGMGNYYPSNVSWPYLLGNPSSSTSHIPGTAAWWWSQVTNSSSPYYNSTLVTTCTSSKPCTWPIGYFDGAPANLVLINDWAGEIYALSGHTLEPYPLAETFTQFLADLVGAYQSPLASSVGFGWAPDYPDPTDYVAPITQPNGDYTAPDTFNAQLALPKFEANATCGHYDLSTSAAAYANLAYWANISQDPASGKLTSSCQGVAYRVASYWMPVAGALPASPQRTLDYNLIEQITNALAMYVYNGQSNALIGFAPWIAPSSVNQNPVIGGGGDSIWFQIQYRSVYAVKVTETGLPSGTNWGATRGQYGEVAAVTTTSTTPTVSFTEELPNGTYNWSVAFVPGYSVSPSNGTFTIAGAAASVSVTYTAFVSAASNVYFNETGLVSNTSWTVVISGYGALTNLFAGNGPASSNGGSLVFKLPDHATYDYQPQTILGYLPPAKGTVTVVAGPTGVDVAYTSVIGPAYLVTFSETGLPAGASWSVTVGAPVSAYLGPPASSYTVTGTTANLTFYEVNASYPVTLTLPAGYVAPSGSIVVSVNGTALTVLVVTFSSTAPPPSSSSTPAWTYLGTLAYSLIGVLALIALVGLASAAYYARRRPPASPPASWIDEQKPSSPAPEAEEPFPPKP